MLYDLHTVLPIQADSNFVAFGPIRTGHSAHQHLVPYDARHDYLFVRRHHLVSWRFDGLLHRALRELLVV